MSTLLFLLLMVFIMSIMTMPYGGDTTISSVSIKHCESGRVCINTCYYEEELINCDKRDVLKSVSFNPPFDKTLPTVHLRLIQIDTNDEMFNPDIILDKENLTSYGMNIRFNLSKYSTNHFICVDWLACALEIN